MNDMQPDRHQPADADLEAPAKFVAALRRTQNQAVFVPPSVDAAVQAAAREHLRQAAPDRIVWVSFARWAGLAASLALLLWLASPAFKRGTAAFAADDVNRDGRVDILDAFALARELERGAKPSPAADLNHDGVVDRRDVDAIANKAVKLAKGGRS